MFPLQSRRVYADSKVPLLVIKKYMRVYLAMHTIQILEGHRLFI